MKAGAGRLTALLVTVLAALVAVGALVARLGDGAGDGGGQSAGTPGAAPGLDPTGPQGAPTSAPSPQDAGASAEGPSPRPARTLSGDEVFPAGFTVPEGQTWQFDPDRTTTVEVGGNVVVRGTLRMQPSSAEVVHTLRFVGVQESGFRGGDTGTPIASDTGLWITGKGELDIQGTPRAGWNRRGHHPTWRPGDNVRVAPVAAGAHEGFEPFSPGSEVPTVTAPDGSMLRTEVVNLTRNVIIEGTGTNDANPEGSGRAHVIFLHCQQPQMIRYAAFRLLGPRQHSGGREATDGVLGRYPLHFHRCGDGSRGSVVEGVVVQASGNHAFVPHASHGITFRDTVAVDVWEDAYWWDHGDETHDLLYDRALAGLVRDDPPFRGYTLTGFLLGLGTNMTVRDSVAVGVQGNKNASGFHWPSFANDEPHNVWTFRGNRAHNNRADCLFTWQNDSNRHVVEDFTGYRCGDVGVEHGAYVNDYRYRDVTAFGNGVDLRHHALTRSGGDDVQTWKGLDVGTLRLDEHALASSVPVRFINLRLRGEIVVAEGGGSGGVYQFVSRTAGTDLAPADFDVRSKTSTILVQNSGGQAFEVLDAGRTRPVEPFA